VKRTYPNVGHALAEIKPIAYVDTVELLFRRFPHGLKQLRGLACEPQVRVQKDRTGFVRWYRLTVHQPSRAVLRFLDHVQDYNNGRLCRFDLALDYGEGYGSILGQSTCMKWRNRGPMHDIGGTTYWIELTRRKRRAGRNLCLYADKPSKITGEVECAHLELRFLSNASCKRQGIERVSDLITADPQEIVRRNLRFYDLNVDEWKRAMVKRQVKKNRDIYRPNQSKRIQSIIERSTQDRVQRIKDLHPRTTMKHIEPNIPQRLSWGVEIIDAFSPLVEDMTLIMDVPGMHTKKHARVRPL